MVLEGVGAALLLLFPYFLPILASNLAIYLHRLPITNLIGGALVDLLGLSILAMGFLVAVQYLPAVAAKNTHGLYTGFMLWRIVDIAILMQTNLRLIGLLGWPAGARSALRSSCCQACWHYFFPASPNLLCARFVLLVAAFAFCALWIIPQLLHLMLIRQPDESAASIHLSPASHSTSNQRIIWILFDELSYDQAFDHPAPGMKLPNLDRLRSESVSFSNLNPAGFYTELHHTVLVPGAPH